MGRMKELAVWLSSCVVQHEMSDEEITTLFNQREDTSGLNDGDPWLQNQINYIRKNPDQFRELLSWKRGKDY